MIDQNMSTEYVSSVLQCCSMVCWHIACLHTMIEYKLIIEYAD